MKGTNHYKSWSGLNKQLKDNLCDELKGRITYFLTRYHKVHNSYGRASICLDGKELTNFSWVEMYQQEADVSKIYNETGRWNYNSPELKEKWSNEGTFSDCDFIEAATQYLQLSIKDALESDHDLIKVFAVMDKRVGKRTLEKIKAEGRYRNNSKWVRQFYELRLN